MLLPNIFGAYDSRELPALRINVGATSAGVDMAQIYADIKRYADFFDKAVATYENGLAVRNNEPFGTYYMGTAGGEMQPYTEYGATEATRTDQSWWNWGTPIRRYRDRQLYTEEYLVTANLQQLAIDVVAATNRYLTTRLKMMLRALLRNTNYTWTDNEFPGDADGKQIPVLALFNADANNGRVFNPLISDFVNTGAIQHYLPSGAAAVSLANFTIGRATLRDLGLTGRVVHIISPNDADTVKALPQFIKTEMIPNDRYATTTPALAAPQTTAVVTRPQAIGTISNGGVSDGEVVVYPFFPAGYTFSLDVTADPPLVIRSHKDAQFQGFRLVQDQTRTAYGDGDLRNKRWEFIAGGAVRNRANGVAVQATVAGAYTAPTI
jgi:hypothetical protein